MKRAGGSPRCLAAVWPGTSHAQTVEVTPLPAIASVEVFSNESQDNQWNLDGAPAVGAVVNVKFRETGLFAEALFTHQEARLRFPGGLFVAPASWRIRSINWQVGGLQEFGTSRRARPFLTGLLGLTRAMPPRVTTRSGSRWEPEGVEADAGRFRRSRRRRVFATFADVDGRRLPARRACASWLSTPT